MDKIPLLIGIIFILFGNKLYGQKIYVFSGEIHYLIKPFNKYNFAAKEVDFYPFKLENELNYQIGLRCGRIKNNNHWFLQAYFTHLSARWDYGLYNYDPIYDFINFERSLIANGFDVGAGYARKFNKFEISSAVVFHAMVDYKIFAAYNAEIGLYDVFIPDDSFRFNKMEYTIREKVYGPRYNINYEFAIAYSYTDRFALHFRLNYAPWNKELRYYFLNITAWGEQWDFKPEVTTLVNRNLVANWIYPKIGISYEF